MQDAYVGDIGDFAKYGLLRAVCGEKRLGVAWYLHPSPPRSTEDHSGDGRHTQYLVDTENWHHFDPQLFTTLRGLVENGDRRVEAVEESAVLGDAVFANELLDVRAVPVRRRDAWRRQWFERVKDRLSDCDLVFADPDNGLCLDERFKPTRQRSAKRIPVTEVEDLVRTRPAVIYHHNTRFPGGHGKEIHWWMERLPGCSWAFYWRRCSNRTFFILNADSEVEDRLKLFAERWKAHGDLLSAQPYSVLRARPPAPR